MTVTTMAVRAPIVRSPLWWVLRLHARIEARRPEIEMYDDYYNGDHRTPWLTPKARTEFARLLELSNSNYMGLVCDSTSERLKVEGFRVSPDSTESDKDVWRIWQANGMDSEFPEAIQAAVRRGRSYLLVAPNPKDPKTPYMYVEDALQVTVEYEPGTNRRQRAAALKVWKDDFTGLLNATLYLPDVLYKFQSASPVKQDSWVLAKNIDWVPRVVEGEKWPAVNPLGVVPIVELTNMTKDGRSEIHDVIPIQDRINKTLADRLMTQDYGAFPQKWAKGYPLEDNDGNPTPQIEIGRDRLVSTEAVEAAFGQWNAAPLDPYSAAKREDVKDIASRTRIPAQYMLGEITNVSGDTLKAAESGLVSKSKQRIVVLSDPLEEFVSLARKLADLPFVDTTQMETIWRSPEYRTDAELVDALVKMSTLGVPREALWERWGASPQEIQRWTEMNNAARLDPLMQSLITNAQPPAYPAIGAPTNPADPAVTGAPQQAP